MIIYFVAFKLGPIWFSTRMPAFFQSSKHFSYVLSGMAFSSFHEFCFITSIKSKWVSRNDHLSFGNSKKPHEIISGEYGGWLIVFAAFLALNWVKTVADSPRIVLPQICLFLTNYSIETP